MHSWCLIVNGLSKTPGEHKEVETSKVTSTELNHTKEELCLCLPPWYLWFSSCAGSFHPGPERAGLTSLFDGISHVARGRMDLWHIVHSAWCRGCCFMRTGLGKHLDRRVFTQSKWSPEIMAGKRSDQPTPGEPAGRDVPEWQDTPAALHQGPTLSHGGALWHTGGDTLSPRCPSPPNLSDVVQGFVPRHLRRAFVMRRLLCWDSRSLLTQSC